MRGTILGFDGASGAGVISGSDGRRYSLAATEWRGGATAPGPGMPVDFESGDGVAAAGVYPIAAETAQPGYAGSARLAKDSPGQPQPSPPPFPPGQPYGSPAYAKSHVVAGLLALFLGSWGIHKFYLGYSNEGVILLVGTIVSFILCIIIIGLIPLMAIGVVCFVEAIIYLTKTDAEFDQMYVQQKKPWF